VKISDKERLDWANRHGDEFGCDMDGNWLVSTEAIDSVWTLDFPDRFKTLRQAIDAAIRAARSRKGKERA
jgi:hypothetical protein